MKLKILLLNAFLGLCLVFTYSILFADKYKDIEWGTDIDEVVSGKDLFVKIPNTDLPEEDKNEDYRFKFVKSTESFLKAINSITI